MEVLALSLKEDYRFPVLEIFAFFYTIATIFFVNANLSGMGTQFIKSEECLAFNLVEVLSGLPLFFILVLIVKNIAFGLGNDLEKGTMQTYLMYPLSRKSLLLAKLLSSVGVALLLFLGIQIFVLSIVAPYTVLLHMSTVTLTCMAALCYPLFVVGIVLLLTFFVKRGGWALIIGIFMQFMSEMLVTLALYLSSAMNSNLIIKFFAVINPVIALSQYYRSSPQHYMQASQEGLSGFTGGAIWSPSFSEASLYLGAGYILVAVIFIFVFYYFERRLEV
jgi:ABC-type transport system involved in multi-copper enzyme maturation permease subunit